MPLNELWMLFIAGWAVAAVGTDSVVPTRIKCENAVSPLGVVPGGLSNYSLRFNWQLDTVSVSTAAYRLMIRQLGDPTHDAASSTTVIHDTGKVASRDLAAVVDGSILQPLQTYSTSVMVSATSAMHNRRQCEMLLYPCCLTRKTHSPS